MWAELGTAAIGALGGLFGAKSAAESSIEGAKLANAANAQQAQLNRDFQERMSSTSYQRGVEDLKKAGLNPGLAYQGAGASSPTGATAVMQNERAQSAALMSSGAQSAATALQQLANIRFTAAQTRQLELESQARLGTLQAGIDRTKNEAGKISQEGIRLENENRIWPELMRKQFAQMAAQLGLTNTQARDLAAAAGLKELAIPAARNQAAIDRNWYGRNIRPLINDATGLKRIFD